MKKKILLAALFSVTVVLAVIGLTAEKSYAQGWYGDDPIWMETGDSVGLPVAQTVYCNETLVSTKITNEYDFNGFVVGQKTTIERVTMSVAKTAIDCATVATTGCTPSNPC